MYSEEQYYKALKVYEETKSVTKTITCKNRHPSPICTRFEHHFHALKPHLHRRSFSDTLPENQRHLIALKRHPLVVSSIFRKMVCRVWHE